jgi:hypothetical protein
MTPAHYINEAELTFDGLTPRELAIYQMGTDHGKDMKADEVQPIISRLEMERANFNEVGTVSRPTKQN